MCNPIKGPYWRQQLPEIGKQQSQITKIFFFFLLNEPTIRNAGDLWGCSRGTTISDCGSVCSGSGVSVSGIGGWNRMGLWDLSVSLLRFQSAESWSWGKGLSTCLQGGAMASGEGWGGGGIGWGRRWVEMRWSEERSLGKSACTLSSTHIAPSLKTRWKCLATDRDWEQEHEGLHGVFQNFLHIGHHWLNWPKHLHISPGSGTNPSSRSFLLLWSTAASLPVCSFFIPLPGISDLSFDFPLTFPPCFFLPSPLAVSVSSLFC